MNPTEEKSSSATAPAEPNPATITSRTSAYPRPQIPSARHFYWVNFADYSYIRGSYEAFVTHIHHRRVHRRRRRVCRQLASARRHRPRRTARRHLPRQRNRAPRLTVTRHQSSRQGNADALRPDAYKVTRQGLHRAPQRLDDKPPWSSTSPATPTPISHRLPYITPDESTATSATLPAPSTTTRKQSTPSFQTIMTD